MLLLCGANFSFSSICRHSDYMSIALFVVWVWFYDGVLWNLVNKAGCNSLLLVDICGKKLKYATNLLWFQDGGFLNLVNQ